jgi:hypothetical protein
MKQSSIEWIYNNLKSHFEHDGDLLEAVKMSFEQAKAMHKDEIENAFSCGDDCLQEQEARMFAQVYYNETFNTK